MKKRKCVPNNSKWQDLVWFLEDSIVIWISRLEACPMRHLRQALTVLCSLAAGNNESATIFLPKHHYLSFRSQHTTFLQLWYWGWTYYGLFHANNCPAVGATSTIPLFCFYISRKGFTKLLGLALNLQSSCLSRLLTSWNSRHVPPGLILN